MEKLDPSEDLGIIGRTLPPILRAPMDRFDAMAVSSCLEEGSLSAARVACAALATVSRKVADLEATCGLSLWYGRAEGWSSPTPAATMAAARRIIEQVQEAEQAAAGEYRERAEALCHAPGFPARNSGLPSSSVPKAHLEVDMRILFADRSVNLVEEQIMLRSGSASFEDPTLVATRVGISEPSPAPVPPSLKGLSRSGPRTCRTSTASPSRGSLTRPGVISATAAIVAELCPVRSITGAATGSAPGGDSRVPSIQIAEHLRSGCSCRS